jgi:hypothetical protein
MVVELVEALCDGPTPPVVPVPFVVPLPPAPPLAASSPQAAEKSSGRTKAGGKNEARIVEAYTARRSLGSGAKNLASKGC